MPSSYTGCVCHPHTQGVYGIYRTHGVCAALFYTGCVHSLCEHHRTWGCILRISHEGKGAGKVRKWVRGNGREGMGDRERVRRNERGIGERERVRRNR